MLQALNNIHITIILKLLIWIQDLHTTECIIWWIKALRRLKGVLFNLTSSESFIEDAAPPNGNIRDDIYKLYQTWLMFLLKFCVSVEFAICQYHIAWQFLSTCIYLTVSKFTIVLNLAFTSFSMLIGLNYLVHIFLATCWINTDIYFKILFF